MSGHKIVSEFTSGFICSKIFFDKLQILTSWDRFEHAKGQLNSEWIYEVIVYSKMPTKNLKDFCPGSLLEGRVEILQIFGWHFGRKVDVIRRTCNLKIAQFFV